MPGSNASDSEDEGRGSRVDAADEDAPAGGRREKFRSERSPPADWPPRRDDDYPRRAPPSYGRDRGNFRRRDRSPPGSYERRRRERSPPPPLSHSYGRSGPPPPPSSSSTEAHLRPAASAVGQGVSPLAAQPRSAKVMTFKQWLSNQPDDIDDDVALVEYNTYKRAAQRAVYDSFFAAHKNDQWFIEKYDTEMARADLEARNAATQLAARQFHAELAKGAEFELTELGAADAVRFMVSVEQAVYTERFGEVPEGEAVKGSTTTTTRADGDDDGKDDEDEEGAVPMETEEREEGEEEGQMAPATEAKAKRQRGNTVLVLKSISPSVASSDIVAACRAKIDALKTDKGDSSSSGVLDVFFSEPNPTKKFHRLAWVVCDVHVDAYKALRALDKTKVGNFELHVGLEKRQQSTHALTPAVSFMPDRARKDLELALSVAREADNRAGVVGVSQALFDAAQTALETKTDIFKVLDRLVLYLRVVHFYCLYSGHSSTNAFALQRLAGRIYLRGNNATVDSTEFTRRMEKCAEMRLSSEVDNETAEKLGWIEGEAALQARKDEWVRRDSVNVVEEGKVVGCRHCAKLFRGEDFLLKHLNNKHQDVIERILKQVIMFNNYVKDPNHMSAETASASIAAAQAASTGRPMSGFNGRRRSSPSGSGGSSSFGRGGPPPPSHQGPFQYVDLDAPPPGRAAIHTSRTILSYTDL